MNNRLKKIKYIINTYRFHIFKTIYVNFKLLPFKQAVFLPFVIYNKTQFKLSKSKLYLNVPAKFGLIKWGFQNDWQVSKYTPSLLMLINGKVYINGNIIVAPGCTVRVHEGVLSFGNKVFIGGGSKVLSNNHIEIDDQTMVAFGSIICDTDFHYLKHNGVIRNCSGTIKIGKNCWIGNNTTIMRNSILPDNTIVGSKSYVNKDFSNVEPMSILIGTPAHVAKSGYERIPTSMEGELRRYFKETNSDAYIQ